MIELRVERRYKKDSYTIGLLYVDGKYFCNTLEDTDRGLEASMMESTIRSKKVKGKTAIPKGVYRLSISYSPKFAERQWALKYKGRLPLVENVKGFDRILIHVGNKHTDTEGCLLVGENTKKGEVLRSTYWFHKLMDEVIMPAWNRGEKIQIRYE